MAQIPPPASRTFFHESYQQNDTGTSRPRPLSAHLSGQGLPIGSPAGQSPRRPLPSPSLDKRSRPLSMPPNTVSSPSGSTIHQTSYFQSQSGSAMSPPTSPQMQPQPGRKPLPRPPGPMSPTIAALSRTFTGESDTSSIPTSSHTSSPKMTRGPLPAPPVSPAPSQLRGVTSNPSDLPNPSPLNTPGTGKSFVPLWRQQRRGMTQSLSSQRAVVQESQSPNPSRRALPTPMPRASPTPDPGPPNAIGQNGAERSASLPTISPPMSLAKGATPSMEISFHSSPAHINPSSVRHSPSLVSSPPLAEDIAPAPAPTPSLPHDGDLRNSEFVPSLPSSSPPPLPASIRSPSPPAGAVKPISPSQSSTRPSTRPFTTGPAVGARPKPLPPGRTVVAASARELQRTSPTHASPLPSPSRPPLSNPPTFNRYSSKPEQTQSLVMRLAALELAKEQAVERSTQNGHQRPAENYGNSDDSSDEDDSEEEIPSPQNIPNISIVSEDEPVPNIVLDSTSLTHSVDVPAISISIPVPQIVFPGDENDDDKALGDVDSRSPSITISVTPSAAAKVHVGGPAPYREGANDGTPSRGLPTHITGGGYGLRCSGCQNPIVGRIVSAMGQRWHPHCFKCTQCGELLEHVSSYENEGKPYCHLDYHENFAPKCYHCQTPIADERFITLDDPALGGQRFYHELHFFCAECGDPFLDPSRSSAAPKGAGADNSGSDEDDVGFTVYRGHPYCEPCHVRLRMPRCGGALTGKRTPPAGVGCGRPIRESALEALGRTWHHDCFVCSSCSKPFDDPAFFQRDDRAYCDSCYRIIVVNEL